MLNQVELRDSGLRGGDNVQETPAHLLAMHLAHHQQQHYTSGLMGPALGMSAMSSASSPATNHHQFGSLSRKMTNGQVRPTYSQQQQRLSTFRPMSGHQHADLVREALEDGLNQPMYETIDPVHLSSGSQYGDYNCATTASGSTASGSSRANDRAGPPLDSRLSPQDMHHTQQRIYNSRIRPQGDEYNVLYGQHKEQNMATGHYGPLEPKEFDLENDQFGFFNALLTVMSMASYLSDWVTDVLVSYLLYFDGNPYWFGLTASITIFSAVTVNAFSIRWYLQDKHEHEVSSWSTEDKVKSSRFKWTLRIAAHLLFLGPVLRYADLLRYGMRSRQERKRKAIEKQFQRDCHLSTLATASASLATMQRSNIPSLSKMVNNGNMATTTGKDLELEYYLLMVHEDRDTALLSLLKSLLESGPQLVLQMYILVKRTTTLPNSMLDSVQMACIVTSLVELSWSIASYQRALRRSVAEKRNMPKMGTVLQFTWRLFTLSSRSLAIALFASEFGYWLLPVAIGHWGIMTIWVMHQGTRFCDTEDGQSRPCHEYLLNMVIGAIYLLCFLNVKDEPTRYKYTAFYVITFVENVALVTLWYLKMAADPLKVHLWYTVPALSYVVSAFFAGILFMLMYYRFFHPNGKPLWINRAARCC
ncbi:XK-related protein 6 [Halotydeus destructor]|nr:XK-related protein 6 [Halotydeus destructor]